MLRWQSRVDSARARAVLASRVARVPSGRPRLDATPKLVVPTASKPASTNASADGTSQAFGSSSGRSRWCNSAKLGTPERYRATASTPVEPAGRRAGARAPARRRGVSRRGRTAERSDARADPLRALLRDGPPPPPGHRHTERGKPGDQADRTDDVRAGDRAAAGALVAGRSRRGGGVRGRGGRGPAGRGELQR